MTFNLLSSISILVIFLLFGIFCSGCDSNNSDDLPPYESPLPTKKPEESPITTPYLTSSIDLSNCEKDHIVVERILEAYYLNKNEWPTINGDPGDIDWNKLVPNYTSVIPVSDNTCNWQVNIEPQGKPCIFIDRSEIIDCECISLCSQKYEDTPQIPSPTPVDPNSLSAITKTGAITWIVDWDEALVAAKTIDMPIMIVFYSDTCGWCKKLFNETFSDEDLGRFLSDSFITVKINIQTSTLDNDFKVQRVPRTIFTNPYGQEFTETQIRGYKSIEDFRETSELVLRDL